MYELVIRGRVPPGPVTHVAPKAAAVEQRGMIALKVVAVVGGGGVTVGASAARVGVGREVVVVRRRGTGDEVSEDFPVFRREGYGESEDGGWKKGEVVRYDWR